MRAAAAARLIVPGWRARLAARLNDIADAIERQQQQLAPAAVELASDGWMPGAIRCLTPKRYHAGRRPWMVRPAQMVVMHYTASPPGDGPNGSDLGRIERWAADVSAESSTHVTVLRDGRIVQLAPLSDRTWHVRSASPAPLDGAGGINRRSIGLDLANVGWLKGGRGEPARDWRGHLHRGAVDFDRTGKAWEPYPAVQIESAERVLRWLGESLPHLRDGRHGRLIGHSEAQSNRVDPGPLCPMARLEAALRSE